MKKAKTEQQQRKKPISSHVNNFTLCAKSKVSGQEEKNKEENEEEKRKENKGNKTEK